MMAILLVVALIVAEYLLYLYFCKKYKPKPPKIDDDYFNP